MSYLLSGEGESFWCVEGVVGDETATVDFAQGQGCGTNDFPNPIGVLGVGAWHDQIADWISQGNLVSATYDPTGRPSEIQTTDQDGLIVTFDWLVQPGEGG